MLRRLMLPKCYIFENEIKTKCTGHHNYYSNIVLNIVNFKRKLTKVALRLLTQLITNMLLDACLT